MFSKWTHTPTWMKAWDKLQQVNDNTIFNQFPGDESKTVAFTQQDISIA